LNNLIKVTEKNGKQLLSAKELYLGLGLNKTNWSRWYPTNIINNGYFEEEVDWVGVRHVDEGNETTDFAISLEFAKHIAMMARTEKSHEYRNYFIKCEKKLKEVVTEVSHLSPELQMFNNLFKAIAQQELSNKQIVAAVQETKQEVQAIREVVEIRPSENWRADTNSVIKKICYKLSDYQKPKEEVYKALQERGACDLKRRLENMRARFLLNGGSKSKSDNMNYLDVIADDKKLIEIYTAIVKEMAIKYKVA
jgi:anti-repressor protein